VSDNRDEEFVSLGFDARTGELKWSETILDFHFGYHSSPRLYELDLYYGTDFALLKSDAEKAPLTHRLVNVKTGEVVMKEDGGGNGFGEGSIQVIISPNRGFVALLKKVERYVGRRGFVKSGEYDLQVAGISKGSAGKKVSVDLMAFDHDLVEGTNTQFDVANSQSVTFVKFDTEEAILQIDMSATTGSFTGTVTERRTYSYRFANHIAKLIEKHVLR
jgi:hypothetical protein